MNMKQEKRLTEIVNSLDGIQKAKAPVDGFAKIQEKLASQRKQSIPINKKSGYEWLKIAAVIGLVIFSNIVAVSNYLELSINNSEESDNYLEMTDFNLYENE